MSGYRRCLCLWADGLNLEIQFTDEDYEALASALNEPDATVTISIGDFSISRGNIIDDVILYNTGAQQFDQITHTSRSSL